MSVKDVIKNSFLEGLGYSAPSIKTILLCLLVAVLVGIYIFVFYRIIVEEGFYSAHFGLSLILITIITAGIILTIQSSVIVSLGMVGALSIVRFRTAIKDPLDLIFLFWAISAGIIAGTGMVGLIIVTSVIISVIFIIFRLIPRKKKNRIFLSVTGEQNIEMNLIKECLSKADKTYRVQSRNLSKAGLSLVVEMKTDDPDALIQSINEISGVQSISVVSGAENTTL